MSDTKNKNSNLGESIARGAGWLVLLRLSIKSISIVSTLILARLLVPDDFGVYALSMAIFSFVELVRAFGFGMALIQNQSATEEHYNTAWTLHFMFSFLAAAILYLLAGPISDWVKEPRLLDVVHFLSFIFLIDAFTNIGVIDFQKYMNFDKEFLRSIIIKISSFAVTIPLVFILRSYWALLYGTLVTTIITVLVSYVMHPFRPKFGLDHWREMLHFSVWLQLNNILRYADRNLEKFLVGRMVGTSSVGMLAMSKEIGSVALVEFVNPINRAAYPAFAKVISDSGLFKKTFLSVFGGIALIAIPASAGIAVLAPIFVPVLLGSQWLETVLLIQILSIANIFSALNSTVSFVFLAAAKQNINFFVTLLKLFIFIPLMIFLIPMFGLPGVFVSILTTSFVLLPVNFYLLRRMHGLTVADVFSQLARPVLSMLLMTISLSFVMELDVSISGIFQELLYLAFLVIIGGSVFVVSMILLWLAQSKPEGAESNSLRVVQKRISLPGWISPTSVPHDQ